MRQEKSDRFLTYNMGSSGGVTIYRKDYESLATNKFLTDAILDFYLQYLHMEMIEPVQRASTHVFSVNFYRTLSTCPGNGEFRSAAARHNRVDRWTKDVNIFQKDFIIVPINEDLHWFLAVICFPGLEGPVAYDNMEPVNVAVKEKAATERKRPNNSELRQRSDGTIVDEAVSDSEDDNDRDDAIVCHQPIKQLEPF